MSQYIIQRLNCVLGYSKIKIIQKLDDKIACPFYGALKQEDAYKSGHLELYPVRREEAYKPGNTWGWDDIDHWPCVDVTDNRA